jgi:RNA 3'-terminal phosphate cyclase (ATP)
MSTGRPLTLVNIRAGRKKPGLMRQHLTCVRAAAEISDARVQGDALNSSELVFEPKRVNAGDYRFRIGSAGSTNLVLQTVFPALALCTESSTVQLEGGTHNPLAPSTDFLAQAFAPQAAKFGFGLSIDLQRHGFVPAGGGVVQARIEPAKLQGVTLVERQGRAKYTARVLISQLERTIATREVKTLVRRLGIDEEQVQIESVESSGPGNVVLVGVHYDNCDELICEPGRVGMKAERVARAATNAVRKYITSGAPIGEHLGDQLMLLAGLAAYSGHSSKLVLQKWTEHCATHQMVLQSFLPISFNRRELDSGVELAISPSETRSVDGLGRNTNLH